MVRLVVFRLYEVGRKFGPIQFKGLLTRVAGCKPKLNRMDPISCRQNRVEIIYVLLEAPPLVKAVAEPEYRPAVEPSFLG
jgi:hypothetical protein